MSLVAVKEQIVNLSAQERAELQEYLSSLDDGTLSAEWHTEIGTRRADFETGRVRFLTQQELFAKFRENS